MEDDYPGIFELTPLEHWIIDEVGKYAKKIKKMFY